MLRKNKQNKRGQNNAKIKQTQSKKKKKTKQIIQNKTKFYTYGFR